MGDGGNPLELAKAFAEVARALRAEDDLDATLTKLVHLAVETLDACQHAGISIIEHRQITSGPRTDDVPAKMDDLQNEVGEGPCLDAISEHETFHIKQLSQEKRWPDFSRRAHIETEVESILALRLYTDEDTIGALNLYSMQPDAFSDRDIAIASVFTAHGSVAVAAARQEENLQQALESRVVIEQAKGKLAGERGISIDDAFDLLRSHARNTNAKIGTVAQAVVESTLELHPRAGAGTDR